jgi:hypothetical protein
MTGLRREFQQKGSMRTVAILEGFIVQCATQVGDITIQ